MVFPWVQFLGKKKRLSDIEYLAIKEFDGKRVDVDSGATITNSSTETTVVTQTAGSAPNKDMYLGGAKMSWQASAASGGANNITLRLFLNAVELEKKVYDNEAAGSDGEYVFLTKGVKVAFGEIIKLTAQNSNASNTTTIHNGKLILFQEDTGASPAV